MVLVDPVGQVNAVDPAREQIDCRGAEGHELLRPDPTFKALVEALEQHDQLQLLSRTALHCAAQLAEVDEQVTLRQGEILLQQPIALKRLGYDGHRGFAVIESAGFQRIVG